MKQHDQTNSEFGWIGILVVIVIAVAIFLRFLHWVSPPSDPPLLVQAEGMVRIANIEDERLSDEFRNILPKETFGGSVRVVGLYPEGGTDFSKNSISVVYEKDSWRMMQVDLLPQTTIENVLDPFNAYIQDTVALPNNRSARIIDIKFLLDCIPSKSKDGIGTCRFTRLLVFEIEPGLIGRIAIDGEKVTDGELITIARSMINSIDEVMSE